MESGGGGVGGGGRGGGWELVEARLQGGAPWGFTLQGGLEHGEPLIISKVEVGGKADTLVEPLLVGDEIIVINDVQLTGYRQEAIALVKGSYKTLKLTIRREFVPGFVQQSGVTHSGFPVLPPPSPPPPHHHHHHHHPPSSPQQQKQTSSHHRQSCPTGGVQLRIKNRRSDPASRPHSWHSAKHGEAQRECEHGEMEAMGSAWNHSYHTSASTTNLSGGFDPGVGYLRKSPDQYSSRGSMESLDPPPSSSQLLPPGAQHHHHHHHHSMGQHARGGHHPAYSSCHQLSSARSSNSIDHLNSKRDSAYSSFSTSSSIPEYLASTPSFSPERSYSLESVPQRGGASGQMQQADVHYMQSAYDARHDQELSSASSVRLGDSRGGGGARPGLNHDPHVAGVCYRGNSSSGSSSSGSSSGGSSSSRSGTQASNRHSVGPIWAPAAAAADSSYENLKGAPAPPRRSDSYAAIRNHERPNSWSSLEHARSLRSLHKGSWHHSSGNVASAKGSYGAEGQLHTVMEKSPESSPTTKPRQGGGFSQLPSPPEPSPGSTGPASQPGGRLGMHPVPQPEQHLALIPGPGPGPSGVHPVQEKSVRRGPQGTDVRDGRIFASSSASSQLRIHVDDAQRPQQDESNLGHNRSHLRSPAGRSEDPTGPRRSQDHQNLQDLQDFRLPQVHAGPSARPASSQEWRETHAPVQSHPHSRSVDTASVHSEPVPYCRSAQGQAPPPHAQAPPTAADKEHPLTRLEMALAEVQRGSDGIHGNGGYEDAGLGLNCSLSVLEKVNRFECRERGTKQRSLSTNTPNNKATWVNDKGPRSPCRADDLRNMLERSTNGTKAHRTMSYRGPRLEHITHRAPADPSSALQRSRSSFHLEEPGVHMSDFPQRGDDQKVLDATSHNRSYRDSVKDAQSKVLRSTSLRHRDLSSTVSSSSSSSHQTANRNHSTAEKRGPKTMPKPQGVVIVPQSPPPPPITSPHTPKERHVVSPATRGPSPPPLPSVPPVGPPALTRICGRKRLMAEQKKRSYSEPENLNEVGISETAALFRHRGETSVADRRKMFELAAVRVGGGAPQSAAPRPDLRQIQHDALAEYMERKRSRGGEGSQRSGARPHSAFIRPDSGCRSVSCSQSEIYSLSPASSLLSLQDTASERSLCSALPPGTDLRYHQSNLFYPGKVTSPRAPVQPPRSPPPPGSPPELRPQSGNRDPGPIPHRQQEAEPQFVLGLSKKLTGALQRAGSDRGSGKSASAEDLLEPQQERRAAPQHFRSRSSPTKDTLNKGGLTDDVRMFDVFVSEPGRCPLPADRPENMALLNHLHSSQPSLSSVQAHDAASSPHTPAARRDRQRNGERQRGPAPSPLAASVGLPCPLTSPRAPDGGGPDWQPDGELGDMDAIAFPLFPCDAELNEDQLVSERQARRSLSDAAILEGTERDVYRGRAHSLENAKWAPAPLPSRLEAPSPERPPSPSHVRLLSSLRISESSLFDEPPRPLRASRPQEDLDEVFLQSPAPPSPPPPMAEDFPPPPTPEELDLADPESSSGPDFSSPVRKTSLSSSSVPPPPLLVPSLTTNTEDGLSLDYQPLPKRERTPEELRVEALSQQLVLQDASLAPLLDTWGTRSTMDLMREIFQSSRTVDKSQRLRLHRSSLQFEERPRLMQDRRTETNMDQADNDINTRKVELCAALRSSVEALQREKDELSAEQRRHQALGADVEALVQDHLKPNERDKFNMFIGDLERIVHLLLSLCGRLSRIDRSLLALQGEELTQEDAAEERESLLHKRSLLLRQTEDAQELKENLERRQRVVHAILRGYLSPTQLQDYRRHVSAKPSLLSRRRHLEELIRQEEDKVARLAEGMPAEAAAEARGRTGSSPFAGPAPFPGPAHSVRPTTVTSL